MLPPTSGRVRKLRNGSLLHSVSSFSRLLADLSRAPFSARTPPHLRTANRHPRRARRPLRRKARRLSQPPHAPPEPSRAGGFHCRAPFALPARETFARRTTGPGSDPARRRRRRMRLRRFSPESGSGRGPFPAGLWTDFPPPWRHRPGKSLTLPSGEMTIFTLNFTFGCASSTQFSFRKTGGLSMPPARIITLASPLSPSGIRSLTS